MNATRKQWMFFVCSLLLVSLVLPSCSKHTAQAIAAEKEIVAVQVQPFRILDLCLDTPPFFPPQLFHEAANAVANSIDKAITVGFGGMDVFIDSITSHSLQDTVLSFAIPAFGPDPAPPAKPSSSNGYPIPGAWQTYWSHYRLWQTQIAQRQHELLQLRHQARAQTNKLRQLSPIYDSTGADVYGCLDTAAQHLQQTATAQKVLVLASPLINNESRQKVLNLNLAGVVVKVIFHACVLDIASQCQSDDQAWRNYLMHCGAQSVSFSDPAESEVNGFKFGN